MELVCPLPGSASSGTQGGLGQVTRDLDEPILRPWQDRRLEGGHAARIVAGVLKRTILGPGGPFANQWAGLFLRIEDSDLSESASWGR